MHWENGGKLLQVYRNNSAAWLTILLLVVAGTVVLSYYLCWHSESPVAAKSPDSMSLKGYQYPDISKTPHGLEPVRDRLITLLTDDPASIFAVVDTIEGDPALRTNCHDIAHDIGHAAYERYGFTGAMNFTDTKRLSKASVQDVCAGGYVHGVLEEAALHEPHFTEQPGAMCEEAPTGSRASCFHGVGHALMFSYLRDTSQALDGCRRAGDASDSSRCFEGVWMEFFWGSTQYSGTESLGWDPKQPLIPCQETSADAKPACFLYSSFGFLRSHVHDYPGAVSLCAYSELNASDENYCLKGVGITMISHLKAGNFESSETYVTELSDNEKTSFYKGVTGYGLLSGIPRSTLAAACDRMQTDAALCSTALAKY